MYGNYNQQPMQGYQDQRYMQTQNPYERRLDMMDREHRQPQSNVNWIPVNGYEDVRGIMVQPGATVWAMDNNEPIFYVKTADQMGVCTIDAYKYERMQVGSAAQPAQNNEYITRSEYLQLVERLEKIEKGEIENVKSADK